MSPEKQAAAPMSHAERIAHRDSSRARIQTAHTSKIEALDDQRRAAHEAKSTALDALEKEHVEQHKAACIKAKRDCAEAFRPLVAEFVSNPTRAVASKISEEFQKLEASSLHSCGQQLEREIGFSFAAHLIEADPSVAARFGLISAFNADVMGCLEESHFASKVLRLAGPAAAPLQLQALENLERKIGRIASEAQSCSESTAKARFDSMRFAPDYESARLALLAADKASWAPIEAAAHERTARFMADRDKPKHAFQTLSDVIELARSTAHSVLDRGSNNSK